MIAMFAKELRESAKWAAVVAAVFLVIVGFEIRRAPADLLFELAAPPNLVFASLAGLLMGFVQSLFETRPDNWAFIVHRPLSRRRIFAAKCLAGLMLLYLSLEIPFLLAAAWAAQPGHLAVTFQSRMMLPTLAMALNAGCYYFAAMVITLRRARWFGSRVLPLGLAIVCSVAVFFATEFWQAMLFVLAGHCIGALAAWNAFATGGAADRRGAPAFALGTMIYAGTLGVGCGLVAALGIFQTTVRWEQYRLDRDGRMLRATWTIERTGERTVVIADTDGRPLPESDGIDPDDPAYADRFARLTNLLDNRDLPWPASMLMHGGYGSFVPGVSRLTAVAKPGVRVRSFCFFNMQRRIIEMYDPVTRVLTGTVGPAGFTAGHAAPAELFPAEALNMRLGNGHTLAFPSAVYWLELDQRRVRRVFIADDNDPVVCTNELPPQADPIIAIATRRRLHLLRSSGQTLLSIPLEYDLTKSYISLAWLQSNHHLIVWAGPITPAADEAQTRLSEYAPDGKLVRQTRLPNLDDGGRARTPRTALFAFVYPPGALPLYRPWLMDFVFELRSQDYWWLFHGCLFAGSLLSALLTLVLSRRYGFNAAKSAIWSIGNLLLGPAGIVVMVSLNELHSRQVCAACGSRRLIGQRLCPSCSAALAPPSLDGREIFEPADALLSIA